MQTSSQPKGPWIHRFSIKLFTLVLAVLVYWVLGFLVEDIESIEGPRYAAIEEKYVARDLVAEEERLSGEMGNLERALANKQEEIRIISESTRNLQETINQLIGLQQVMVEKSGTLTGDEKINLTESLAQFLDNQKRFQNYNRELAKLMEDKRDLENQQQAVTAKMAEQREPARREYERLREKHDLYLALLQLLILIPLLVVGVIFTIKLRGSLYFPLVLGYGSAVLLKVSLVIHEYFPARYLKYVLVLGLIAAVVKLLVYFIRVVAYPQAQWLTRQYREAYERFLCPICEYPIRTGPRKFLFWTRRTVNKVGLPRDSGEEGPYACPACGTQLFEECPVCHGLRHSLLPFCEHCGTEK